MIHLNQFLEASGLNQVHAPELFRQFPLREQRPLAGVNNLTQYHGLKVIEDASHSPGSFVNNDKITTYSSSCSHSDAACLSFHPVKHICCGEGGAVLTNDKLLETMPENYGLMELNDLMTIPTNLHGFTSKQNSDGIID